VPIALAAIDPCFSWHGPHELPSRDPSSAAGRIWRGRTCGSTASAVRQPRVDFAALNQKLGKKLGRI